MSGDDVSLPVSADRYIVEIAPNQTIAVRLHVSFLTSLFQRMGAQIRDVRRGAVAAKGRDPVLSRFAAVCPPIEILRWGEYAVRDAPDVHGVRHSVRQRADEWASELTAAIEHLADSYRSEAWPQDRAALMETQQWLGSELRAAKDDIILGLRRGLELAHDDRPLDVVLVRQAFDVAGAHSHPIVVDTSRFVGPALVEVLFHEIGHELLDLGVGLDQSGISVLHRALAAVQNSRVTVHDLLHVSLFAHVGVLVRTHFDPAHQPVLFERGRLERMLQKMQVAAPESEVITMLERHAAGELGLADLANYFTGRSVSPVR
jgi:hypothetical protein